VSEPLSHGGDLVAATRRFGLPPGGWLDLSTGINPDPWPAPPLPPAVLARLPLEDGALEAAAAAYYGSDALLPVPGSQAAIQCLPSLRPPGEVAVLGPTYAEHAHRWRAAGHRVTETDAAGVEAGLDRWSVVVVVNPDNPSGRRLARERLEGWREALAARGGWLVVDEAFADLTPEASLAPRAGAPGLVVLRSLGKFFGLAGLRLGFVLAERAVLAPLAEALGPWAVSGPARWWGTLALRDRAWQGRARARLVEAAARLDRCLAARGWEVSGGTALFRWLPGDEAPARQAALARAGVWTRVYAAPLGLRIGLPPAGAWARLEAALEAAEAP